MSATLTRGYTFGSSETVTNVKLHALVDSGTVSGITDAAVASGAAIAYSKLNLAGSISDGDINASASISLSKINLTGFGLIPSGGIIAWSGTIATIPSGWFLCNGSNSTPDLRDKFIIGAKQDSSGIAKTNVSGSLTQSGGAATKDLSHTHTGTTGSPSGTTNVDGSSSPVGSGTHTHSFTTASSGSSTQDVLNPYYALAWIMKS